MVWKLRVLSTQTVIRTSSPGGATALMSASNGV